MTVVDLVAAGLAVVGVVATVVSGGGPVPAALVLAVAGVVPVGVRLHPVGSSTLATVALVAAVPATVSLGLGQGASTGLAVVPWLLVALVVLVRAVSAWWERPVVVGPGVAWPVAAGYLVVGAAWLVADRFGVEPVGVAPPFVALTAIHFHYAGFGAVTLAGCAWRRRPTDRLAAVAAGLVLVAPPLVALGFTFWGVLQVVGGALLATGLWVLAWVGGTRIARGLSGWPRWLLVASSLAVLAPMVLAVHWAAGTNLGFPVLGIRDMALLHGWVNAVGFTLCGLGAWRLLGDEGRAAE